MEYLSPNSINGLNLYCYCNNNPIMYVDTNGHMPKWLQWLIGGVLVIGAIVLTIATSGLGLVIAGAIGTGFWASVVGGAIAGGIIGAVSGAMISAGTQIITNGFENFSWSEVGKGTLSGLITGAIAGGVFGGITHFYSAEKLANAYSGLDAAKYKLNNSFVTLKNVNSLSKMPFANTNITKAIANAAINYSKAYSNYVIAKGTYEILKGCFSAAYLVGENYLSNCLGNFM